MQEISERAEAVKAELDRLEFIERVSELQREVAEFEDHLTDSGALILKLPKHPAVAACVQECAGDVARKFPLLNDALVCGPRDIDLPTARRKLRAARRDYEKRVCIRSCNGYALAVRLNRGDLPKDWPVYGSLRAIIEARALARYWFNIVHSLEPIKRTIEHNHRVKVANALHSVGIAP
jgi:hypothetical protein